jgi:hypothetical protein
MGQLMGFMGWWKMAHLMLFSFFFSSPFFGIVLYFYIFIFLHITKVLPHLTPVALKTMG